MTPFRAKHDTYSKVMTELASWVRLLMMKHLMSAWNSNKDDMLLVWEGMLFRVDDAEKLIMCLP